MIHVWVDVAQLIGVLINHVPLQNSGLAQHWSNFGPQEHCCNSANNRFSFPNFSTPRHQCTYANNTHLIFQIHHHTSVVNAYSVVWDFRPQDIAALLQIAHVHALQVLAPIMGAGDIITKLAWVTIAQYFLIWKAKGQIPFSKVHHYLLSIILLCSKAAKVIVQTLGHRHYCTTANNAHLVLELQKTLPNFPLYI